MIIDGSLTLGLPSLSRELVFPLPPRDGSRSQRVMVTAGSHSSPGRRAVDAMRAGGRDVSTSATAEEYGTSNRKLTALRMLRHRWTLMLPKQQPQTLMGSGRSRLPEISGVLGKDKWEKLEELQRKVQGSRKRQELQKKNGRQIQRKRKNGGEEEENRE
ncbi:hypothetical protein Aduo_013479 [Ancylostoma duodenale]